MKTLAMLLFLCGSPLAYSQSSCLVLATNMPAKGSAIWTRQGAAQAHMLTYLWGTFPKGFHFESYIKDKEVDKIKEAGAKVIILDPSYTRGDLEKAKKDCGSTVDLSAGR